MKLEHRELPEQLRPARRVLIVDDHWGFRQCARTLLTSEGFEVVGEAEDGAAAIARVAELAPDLVLLDIQLPDMDGFEVVERLHSVAPGVPVVLISSRDESAYGPLIEQSGARGFVSKGELSRASLERLLE